MKYDLRNNTQEDITIGNNIIPAETTICIFDTDANQYEIGLTLIKTYWMALGVHITSTAITFIVDNVDVKTKDYYAIVDDWNKKLQGNVIPYLEQLGNAHFDLADNKLKIKNVLDNKTYEVQLIESA